MPARSNRLLGALLSCALLSMASECSAPGGSVVHEVALGAHTLRYWQVDARRVSRTAYEYSFAASLSNGTAEEVEILASIGSVAADTVVVDGGVRFGPVAASAVAPGLDTFRIRHDRRALFDPESLVFSPLDRFGGWMEIESEATGRFRVEEIDGRWWFVTPPGHAFFSAGVSAVNFRADYSPPIDRRPYHEAALAKYGSDSAWAEATGQRLRGWNLNTLGAWSDPERFETSLPYTPVLSLNRAAPAVPGWPTGQTGQAIRDYFVPELESELALRAEAARPCAEDPFCIGVFTDNELPWGRSVLQFGTYVDAYLTLPADAAGKRALQTFFEERYAGDLSAFNAAWSLELPSFDAIQQLDALEDDVEFCNEAGRRADRQAFVATVADRYFEKVHAALRAVDPELLILGPRFLAVYTAPEIVEAAAPYVDVVSLNDYDWDAQGRGLFAAEGAPYGYLFPDDAVSDLETLYEISERPVLISEWTVRTPTPDVDVLFPPFIPTAAGQTERADRYQAFTEELLERPYVVGSHWFKFHDQPATGRGDGENSLFGVVDLDDDAYPELTERMAATNEDLYRARLRAASDGAPTLHAEQGGVPALPLGTRELSITQPAPERSGFFVHILPGSNLAASIVGGPLVLDAGAPDAAGVAGLSLAEDVVLAFVTVVGDVACLRLQSEGSFGEIACEGGVGHDVHVEQASGAEASPPVTEAFLGDDSGPGAATLRVPMEFAQLPAGAAADDCATTDAYRAQHLAAFSTAVVTSVKGAVAFDTVGEGFVCAADGATWRSEDGPGMLVVGVPTFDPRVPGGDLAAAFRLSDSERACRP